MSILQQIAQALIPVVALFLSTELIKLVPKLDALGSVAKQILVVAEAIVFSFIGSHIGVALPSMLSGFDVGVFTAILQALAAMGFHGVTTSVKGAA